MFLVCCGIGAVKNLMHEIKPRIWTQSAQYAYAFCSGGTRFIFHLSGSLCFIIKEILGKRIFPAHARGVEIVLNSCFVLLSLIPFYKAAILSISIKAFKNNRWVALRNMPENFLLNTVGWIYCADIFIIAQFRYDYGWFYTSSMFYFFVSFQRNIVC